ncbi:hypothetical protein [Aurantibacter aestuarii]|uniref:Uncharacterized protein n=1 Tax=Aurantibacter aestuarii TaxID=1266046 RepID=A0A2T1N4Q5_9FLAO|nr:hypothetical protein [Aurantibacter aestuarii]PSG86063.1 hypothetical protein C7H52_13015 [Aurantibacter aestuarii]
MSNEDYLKDLSEIKQLMTKSSRFISLSGLSGILAGIYALIGAFLGYQIIYANNSISTYGYRTLVLTEDRMIQIFVIAFVVVVASILTGILLSYSKAKKRDEVLWDATSKRLIINFAIPLVTGGFFILLLIEKEVYAYVAPLTLVFYGLACVNASKYTLGDIRYLGLTMIIIGLISVYFLGYGLFFWALGFGICHIFYGSLMYLKHDRT